LRRLSQAKKRLHRLCDLSLLRKTKLWIARLHKDHCRNGGQRHADQLRKSRESAHSFHSGGRIHSRSGGLKAIDLSSLLCRLRCSSPRYGRRRGSYTQWTSWNHPNGPRQKIGRE
jgi:hypothetical protein